MTHSISIDQNYLEKYATSDWMETHTGLKFFPARPTADSVNIFDIAHALALKCRYGGHSKTFYSVAEHCTTLALYARYMKLPVRTQFHLLMHEGGETYLPDVPRPIKHFFPELILMEKVIDSMVRMKWALDDDLPPEVKEFDSRIIKDERAQVMFPSKNNWQTDQFEALGVTLTGYLPSMAEAKFLQVFQTISAEYIGRPTLLCYDDGEFPASVAGRDVKDYKAPNLQLVDLIGKCALAKDDNGQPYYIHGPFDLLRYGQ